MLTILIVFLGLFTIKVNTANDKINIKDVKIFEKSQDILVDKSTLENKDDQDYKLEEIVDNNEISSLKKEYEYDKKIKKIIKAFYLEILMRKMK